MRSFQRLIRAFAWLAIAIVIPLYAVKVYQKTDYTDFDVYYKAATRAKAQQWSQIYNLGDGASPFRYAPILIPILRPAAELPLPVAKQLWYFLQIAFFALGFRWIYKSVALTQKARKRGGTGWVTAVSFLFILRLCLDTFTIGQVSSFLFAGMCLGLWGWMCRRPALSGIGVFFPAAFKIGPGFQYLLLGTGRTGLKVKPAILAVLGLFATLALGLWAFVGSKAIALGLARDWVRIVSSDSGYFDASHYGSQSLKSALLRLANAGWIGTELVNDLFIAALVLGCSAVAAFWVLRRPKGYQGRGLFYGLGIFPYLWFMPETFKYSMTVLAIPVAFLLLDPTRLSRAALVFGALTISLAGKDLMPDALFFGMQKASLPFLGITLLGIATFRAAARASVPSNLHRALFDPRPGAPGPWRAAPPEAALDSSLLIPIRCGRGSALDVRSVAAWIDSIARDARPSEVLLIPFGEFATETHPLVRALSEQVRAPHRWVHGRRLIQNRGYALRAGFFEARGRQLWFAHPEQRANAAFYAHGAEQVNRDARSLVTANRRHVESRFVIPVKLLRLVYGRHRLGLLFNRLIRIFLPIRLTDTHSGSWVVPRALASELFALQTSGGFLFDLEIVLTAQSQGYRLVDRPVSVSMTEEKSPVRILREVISIARGLPGLSRRAARGYYAQLADRPQAISADDWGISPGVNEGILELSRLGIIRRASLMANCGALTHRLRELQAVPGIQLGIHFNLTYGDRQPFGHGSPGRFLLRALNPFLDRAAWRERVARELESQLRFLESAGVRPSYFDGHHHIHLVPGLIDAVAPILKAHGIRQIRLPYDPALWTTRHAPLNVLSWLARGPVRRHGFQSLPCFYPRQEHFQDPGRLRADLSRFKDSEVIVHPALFDDFDQLEFKDPYHAGRVTEFHALKMLASAALISPKGAP